MGSGKWGRCWGDMCFYTRARVHILYTWFIWWILLLGCLVMRGSCLRTGVARIGCRISGYLRMPQNCLQFCADLHKVLSCFLTKAALAITVWRNLLLSVTNKSGDRLLTEVFVGSGDTPHLCSNWWLFMIFFFCACTVMQSRCFSKKLVLLWIQSGGSRSSLTIHIVKVSCSNVFKQCPILYLSYM